jgi:hypothetical protein
LAKRGQFCQALAKTPEGGGASTRSGGSAKQRAERHFANVWQNRSKFAEHWQKETRREFSRRGDFA